MAGTFPTLRSGHLAFYGTELGVSRPTKVMKFWNDTEQRFRSAQPLFYGTLEYTDANQYDIGLLQSFFVSQKGAYDSTWSLSVTDLGTTTVYNNMVFDSDDFVVTNSSSNRCSVSLRVRQVAANSSSPTLPAIPATNYFPQVGSGLITQLPYGATMSYATDKVAMESGAQWSYAHRGAGLTRFPTGPLGTYSLSFSTLTDSELVELRDFFIQQEGRLREFIYLDPLGNLVTYSEDFSSADWEKNDVTVGSAVADPFGGSLAYLIGSSSSNSNMVTTVLPDGQASGMVLTGSAWVKALGPGRQMLIGFVDSGFSLLGYTIWDLAENSWVRVAHTITLATNSYVRLLIGGLGTWNTNSIHLFGPQVVPMPGPGGYARTPHNYGYRPHCRFTTDVFTYKKLGPNHNSLTLGVEEIWA